PKALHGLRAGGSFGDEVALFSVLIHVTTGDPDLHPQPSHDILLGELGLLPDERAEPPVVADELDLFGIGGLVNPVLELNQSAGNDTTVNAHTLSGRRLHGQLKVPVLGVKDNLFQLLSTSPGHWDLLSE